MPNGGQTAIRGYLVQTLIALLDALDDERPWTSVTLEPNVDSDKVDILWRYRDGTKAVQVKSSQNPFRKTNIQSWARDLEAWKKADEYELVLVGQHGSPAVAKIRHVGNVSVPPAKNLDLVAFLEQAAYRLERFLEKHGLPTGKSQNRELLAEALAARLATYSTKGRAVRRATLVKQLQEWRPGGEASDSKGSRGRRSKLVLRVFVSAPDDVTEERAALEDIIASINKTGGERGV